MEREELLMQIVEKQKELIRRRCQHSPSCSINQNWDEAWQAIADTPVAYQDAYYEAISEIERKSKECTCGLKQLESELASLASQLEKTEKPTKPAESADEVKQKYVAGFMFTTDGKHVVLIRKNKPEWQEGKLNGVGGKIEPNESPLNAMIREFKEESGVIYNEWDNFLTIEYKTCIVYFFKGFNNECFLEAETKEDEYIIKISLSELYNHKIIPNLNWIINLALDSDIQHTESVEEYAQSHQVSQVQMTDQQIKDFAKDYCSTSVGSISPLFECGLIVGLRLVRDGKILAKDEIN